ncbi:hypothetical protein J4443_01845 [Candidatus Woesearchaeota archaeon]|nr:hypothetical protein [Candidatus Woesearchaeota archaeon]
MSEKDYIARGIKVRQQAVFDMADLYKIMFRWFSQHNYDFQERQYMQRMSPDGSRHLEIGWQAGRKISDYIKFRIDIKFLVIGLSSVEVDINSMKRKTNKGDAEMRFDAYLELDYEGKWEGNPVTKVLREFYNRWVIKSRIEDYEAELHEELYELIGEIKSLLNLYKFQGLEAQQE